MARSATRRRIRDLERPQRRPPGECGRNFPKPSIPNINAAAATTKTVPPGGVSIVNPPGVGEERLAGFDVHLRDRPESTSTRPTQLKKFITYAIGPGQEFAADLGYGTLPKQVVTDDKALINKIGS